MQHPASVPFQCMTLFSTWNSIQFSSPEEIPLFAIIAIIIIVLNSHQKRLKPIVMAIKWTCVNVWRWGQNCISLSFQQSAHPLSHPQVWAVYWLCCTTAQMHISIIHGTEIKFNIGKSVESGQLCGNAIEKVYRKIIPHDDGIVYATENAQQIQWSDNEITEVACISLLILLNWQIVYYFLTSGGLCPRSNDSIIVGIRSIFSIHFKCVCASFHLRVLVFLQPIRPNSSCNAHFM